MIERDLLTLIRDAEQAGEEKVENARKKAEELRVLLEKEKADVVKKMEEEFEQRVKAERKKAEEKFRKEIETIKENKEKVKSVLSETAKGKIEEIASEIADRILKEANLKNGN